MTDLDLKLREARAKTQQLHSLQQAESELEQLEAEVKNRDNRATWQAELAKVDNRIGKVAGDYRRSVKKRDSAIRSLIVEFKHVLSELRTTQALSEELATLAQQKASLEWQINNPEGITPQNAGEARDVIRDAGHQELIDRGDLWPLGAYRATSRDSVTEQVLTALSRLVKMPILWPRAESAKINIVLHDGTQVQENA